MNHLSPELIHVLMADRLAEAEHARQLRQHSGRTGAPRWRRRVRGPRDSLS